MMNKQRETTAIETVKTPRHKKRKTILRGEGKSIWKKNPTREKQKQILKSICPLLSIPKRTKRRYDNIFVWKKSFLTTRIIEIKRKWVRNGTILKKLKNLRAKKTQKWTFKNRYRSKFLKYTLPWNIKHEKSGKKQHLKKILSLFSCTSEMDSSSHWFVHLILSNVSHPPAIKC